MENSVSSTKQGVSSSSPTWKIRTAFTPRDSSRWRAIRNGAFSIRPAKKPFRRPGRRRSGFQKESPRWNETANGVLSTRPATWRSNRNSKSGCSGIRSTARGGQTKRQMGPHRRREAFCSRAAMGRDRVLSTNANQGRAGLLDGLERNRKQIQRRQCKGYRRQMAGFHRQRDLVLRTRRGRRLTSRASAARIPNSSSRRARGKRRSGKSVCISPAPRWRRRAGKPPRPPSTVPRRLTQTPYNQSQRHSPLVSQLLDFGISLVPL